MSFRLLVCRCPEQQPIARVDGTWFHIGEGHLAGVCPDEGGYDIITVDLHQALVTHSEPHRVVWPRKFTEDEIRHIYAAKESNAYVADELGVPVEMVDAVRPHYPTH